MHAWQCATFAPQTSPSPPSAARLARRIAHAGESPLPILSLRERQGGGLPGRAGGNLLEKPPPDPALPFGRAPQPEASPRPAPSRTRSAGEPGEKPRASQALPAIPIARPARRSSGTGYRRPGKNRSRPSEGQVILHGTTRQRVRSRRQEDTDLKPRSRFGTPFLAHTVRDGRGCTPASWCFTPSRGSSGSPPGRFHGA